MAKHANTEALRGRQVGTKASAARRLLSAIEGGQSALLVARGRVSGTTDCKSEPCLGGDGWREARDSKADRGSLSLLFETTWVCEPMWRGHESRFLRSVETRYCMHGTAQGTGREARVVDASMMHWWWSRSRGHVWIRSQ